MLSLANSSQSSLCYILFLIINQSYLVPKADGSIYVGATSEHAGFNNMVNAAG